MAPYSIPLHTDCDDAVGCNKEARYTVFGADNERYGNYCPHHCQERIADLNRTWRLKTRLEREASYVHPTERGK